MKWLLLAFALFVTSCFLPSESESRFDETPFMESFQLTFPVGDTLYYRNDMYNVRKDGDTITAFAQWVLRTDTIINGETWYIYDGVEYLENLGTIDTVYYSIHVNQSDTGVVVADAISDEYWGKNIVNDIMRSTQREISRDMNYQEICSALWGRTSVNLRTAFPIESYKDYTLELSYPLFKGKLWMNRNDTVFSHTPVGYLCHGSELLSYNGNDVPVVKVELLTGEAFGIHDLTLYEWYDSLGILTTHFDFGQVPVYNADGSVMEKTMSSTSSFRRISRGEMKPEELHPF